MVKTFIELKKCTHDHNHFPLVFPEKRTVVKAILIVLKSIEIMAFFFK